MCLGGVRVVSVVGGHAWLVHSLVQCMRWLAVFGCVCVCAVRASGGWEGDPARGDLWAGHVVLGPPGASSRDGPRVLAARPVRAEQCRAPCPSCPCGRVQGCANRWLVRFSVCEGMGEGYRSPSALAIDPVSDTSGEAVFVCLCLCV
jgi:hypothetical protein